MVMLHESDIQTKEVLSWQGIHLFHHPNSTCSQKVRIFLNLKHVQWTSHEVNLIKKEQLSDFYMGINPRGLIPTLAHDGKVIIESNDILEYLEQQFPTPALIPFGYAGKVSSLLKMEDDLHLDIRALTMRFVFPTFMVKRPEKDLSQYETTGSGKVAGELDTNRLKELNFWRDMNRHNGITDEQATRAFIRFKQSLDQFDAILTKHDYLIDHQPSALDIAWYIYARRLIDAGYPLARLHSNVGNWFERLHQRPEFRDEVPRGIVSYITRVLHFTQRLATTTLMDVVNRTDSAIA